jgi:hypothetical protein
VSPKVESYVVIPDIHAPYHDLKFLDAVAQAVVIVKPKGVIQLGDALDCWQISQYDKNPTRKSRIVDDIRTYNEILDVFEKIMPRGSQWIQLEGNHEDRLRRYMWKNAGAVVELCRDWPELLKFDQRNARRRVNFSWFPLDKWDACKIGDTTFHHGHFFSKHVAANNLNVYRCNFIQGHTHRLQSVDDQDYFSVSLGHGSDPIATAHTPTPNPWKQAFGIYDVIDGKGHFTPVRFTDGTAVVRNKVVRVA